MSTNNATQMNHNQVGLMSTNERDPSSTEIPEEHKDARFKKPNVKSTLIIVSVTLCNLSPPWLVIKID